MSTESLIKGISLGYFEEVGITAAAPPPSYDKYLEWLEAGSHGSMSYLERHKGKKADPQKLLAGAKSWIVLISYYDTSEPLSEDVKEDMKRQEKGWVARYARGQDYHQVIAQKHEKLIERFSGLFQEDLFLSCVDTQAVLERDVARQAGLGWIGKNTCLIHKKWGSFIFISEILTTLELEPDRPVLDHCGTCTRCLEACPTGALEGPYFLNATKCISYWTIESKVSPPLELAKKFGQNIFGCDICQDVCPWNRKARKDLPLRESPWSGQESLREIILLSDEEISKKTNQTALNRAKPPRLRANALNALHNCEGP